MVKRPIRIIAHRCRGYGEEENTRAAFKKALASEVDEIEMDLQITGDRELVVWHNPHFSTLIGKKQLIRKTTLAEVKRHGLMSCEEALRLFKKKGQGKLLNIDIKKYGEEEQFVKLIQKYTLEKRVIVVSWIAKSLESIHTLAPSLELSYTFVPKVYTTKKNGMPVRPAFFLPKILNRLPLKTVNLVSHFLPVSRSIVTRIKKLGIDVVVCNEDTIPGNERLIKIGVGGSMTNKPKLLLEKYGK